MAEGLLCQSDDMTSTPQQRRTVFRDLHRSGTFVMPNPFDRGTTQLLSALGFPALASTSSGFAATLGRADMNVTRDELVAHIAALTGSTDLPINVDAERCYAEDTAGIAATINLLADAGAAGISIEDWNPATNAIDAIDVATDRVAAAASAATAHGVVLTGRCENHLHGVSDLDDTITRLCTYRDAGAEVVYPPGLTDIAQIRRVVDEVGVPVNILLMPGGPTVQQLAEVGVRRVSLGGALFKIAFGAIAAAAQSVLETGQYAATTPFLSRDLTSQTLR
jgi:2-methylisocitrate lyase-like PEP mutase family enzyme